MVFLRILFLMFAVASASAQLGLNALRRSSSRSSSLLSRGNNFAMQRRARTDFSKSRHYELQRRLRAERSLLNNQMATIEEVEMIRQAKAGFYVRSLMTLMLGVGIGCSAIKHNQSAAQCQPAVQVPGYKRAYFQIEAVAEGLADVNIDLLEALALRWPKQYDETGKRKMPTDEDGPGQLLMIELMQLIGENREAFENKDKKTLRKVAKEIYDWKKGDELELLQLLKMLDNISMSKTSGSTAERVHQYDVAQDVHLFSDIFIPYKSL